MHDCIELIDLAMSKRRVAIVQTRSYDSLNGGDGLYIHGIRKHLYSLGCDVYTFTSNPSKDRPRLLIELKYGDEGRFSNRMRGVARLWGRYVMVNPRLLKDGLLLLARKLLNLTLPDSAEPMTAGEIRWVRREIMRCGAHDVILCFEAAHSLAFDDLSGINTLHLYGFLNKEQYKIDGGLGSAASTLDELLATTAGQRRKIHAAFSSRDEKERAQSVFPQICSYFVGMGMPAYREPSQPIGDIALFVGNKTAPNRDSLQYFLRMVWPLVRKCNPNARLWVVGRIGHWFSADASNGIDILGEVPDLSISYQQAKLVVAPLVGGSAGVKTKIAEAISHGRAVVTTSIGVDRHDPHQLDKAGYIEDAPNGFANRILEIFANDELRKSLERGTRDVFDNLYSNRASYAELEQWLRHTGDMQGTSALAPA